MFIIASILKVLWYKFKLLSFTDSFVVAVSNHIPVLISIEQSMNSIENTGLLNNHIYIYIFIYLEVILYYYVYINRAISEKLI